MSWLRHINQQNFKTLLRALRRESPGQIFRNLLRLLKGTNIPTIEHYCGQQNHELYPQWLARQPHHSGLQQKSFAHKPQIGIWLEEGPPEARTMDALQAQIYTDWYILDSIHQPPCDFIVFVPNGNLLSPLALFDLVDYLNQHPAGDLFYCDEDVMAQNGHRHTPDFKWPWSPERLLAYNYIRQPLAVKKACWDELGGKNKHLGKNAWWDFCLRAMAQNFCFVHIPQILYHKSAPDDALSEADRAKGKAVLQAHLDHLQSLAKVVSPPPFAQPHQPLYHLEWPHTGPLVTLMIPTKNHYRTLKRCIDSLAHTTYTNYEVLILDNDSTDKKNLKYLQELDERPPFQVITIPNEAQGFSFSHINNQGAKSANGELLLLLNDDTEVLSPNWLSQMVGYHSLPGVGIVGAKLQFPDGKIQHAGIGLGLHTGEKPGWPVHFFRNQTEEEVDSPYHTQVSANFSAVTGACLLISKALYNELGGLDEKDFPLSFNDIDLCLRAAKAGKRTVLASQALLRHFESKSRKGMPETTEYAHFLARYPDFKDPYYHSLFDKRKPFALNVKKA